MEDIVKQLVGKKISFTSVIFNIHNSVNNTKVGVFNKKWYNKKGLLFISKEMALEYQELRKKWKNNILKTNTKVYNTQLSQFPSFKLKNYIEENKLNVSFKRTWRDLDTVIIGNDFIKELFKLDKALQQQHYVVPIEFMKKNYTQYISGKSVWNPITENYILIESNDLEKAIQFDSSFAIIKHNFPCVLGTLICSNNTSAKAFSQYDFFLSLPQNIKKWNLEVVYDDTLSNETNKGMVLDIEIFSNLLTMISSEDPENINMVKEIMANSEYEASEPYLSYIINVHPKLRIVNGNNNYKFLLEKLEKFKIGNRNSVNRIDEILKNLVNIAPQYSEIYAQCIKAHFNHIMGREVIKEIIT